MIVSDEQKFVFIHIPKCAGTFVRRNIEPFDSFDNRFWGTRDVPGGERYDYAHLTLAQLSRLEPEVACRLASYTSVAVLRDPEARFVSSMLEYFHKFRKLRKEDVDQALFDREAWNVAGHLVSSCEHQAAGLAHFNRQCDYIYLDGRCKISRLYSMEHMERFIDDVEQQLGTTFDRETHHNRSPKGLRNQHLKRIGKSVIGPLAWAGLIPSAEELSLRFSRKPLLARFYSQKSENLKLSDPDLIGFVQEFYRADAVLHQLVNVHGGMMLQSNCPDLTELA